jgi:nucleotide-binding universal stress UspA family protein
MIWMSTPIFIKKILVPIDGSDLSFKAAAYAIHLAKADNSEVMALNVVEDIKQGGAIGLQAKYGNVSLVDAFRKARKESAEQWMSKISQEAKSEGVSFRSEIIDDEDISSEAGVITEFARQNNFDLIVIGSKGRSKLERFLMGGVTNSVVNSAQIPVLVVR